MKRKCCRCHRVLKLCNGFVNAGDFLKCMEGKLEYTKVRELCGICVERENRKINEQS